MYLWENTIFTSSQKLWNSQKDTVQFLRITQRGTTLTHNVRNMVIFGSFHEGHLFSDKYKGYCNFIVLSILFNLTYSKIKSIKKPKSYYSLFIRPVLPRVNDQIDLYYTRRENI